MPRAENQGNASDNRKRKGKPRNPASKSGKAWALGCGAWIHRRRRGRGPGAAGRTARAPRPGGRRRRRRRHVRLRHFDLERTDQPEAAARVTSCSVTGPKTALIAFQRPRLLATGPACCSCGWHGVPIWYRLVLYVVLIYIRTIPQLSSTATGNQTGQPC